MRASTNQRELFDRSHLDERIAFATTTFIVAFAFIALLDRIGAPRAFIEVLAPGFTIAALATLGFLLHSMRASLYYTAGRAVPAYYAGLANAAIVMGLALPFATQFAGRSWLIGACGGFFIGLAGVAFYLGPLLRKTGAFTLSGLLAARFPGLAPRLCVIAVTGVSAAFVALAGHQTAVDALSGLTGVGRGFAAFVMGVAILLIAGPGGLSGVIWAASAAAGVALAGFGWPVLLLAMKGELPGAASAAGGWGEAIANMEVWGALAPSAGVGFEFAMTLAVALGVLTLAPVLAPAVTTRDAPRARRAGWAALIWTLILATLVATTIAAAALAVARVGVGRSPEHLPDVFYAASSRGLVKICDTRVHDPAEARRACAAHGLAQGAPLRVGDVAASGRFLLAGLPELDGFGAAASGLLSSALIALGLALAASGLQACATAIGHEAFYLMRGETDLTSRRLAVTRLALVAVTAFGSASCAANLFDPRALVGLALSLSAAAIAPVVALAFWPRADDRDALIALIGGHVGMASVYVMTAGAPNVDVFALASLSGAALGLAAGAISALSRPAPTMRDAAFVARMLHGDGQIMGQDKGA